MHDPQALVMTFADGKKYSIDCEGWKDKAHSNSGSWSVEQFQFRTDVYGYTIEFDVEFDIRICLTLK